MADQDLINDYLTRGGTIKVVRTGHGKHLTQREWNALHRAPRAEIPTVMSELERARAQKLATRKQRLERLLRRTGTWPCGNISCWRATTNRFL